MRNFICMTLVALVLSGCQSTEDQKQTHARIEQIVVLSEEARSPRLPAKSRAERAEAILAQAERFDEEPLPAVQAALVRALVEIAATNEATLKRARELLLEWAAQETKYEFVIRAEVVQGLIRVKGPKAAQRLGIVLSARDPRTGLFREPLGEIRVLAARGLGDINGDSEIAALIEALLDPKVWVRHHAELSLFRITGGKRGRSYDEWKIWYRARAGR